MTNIFDGDRDSYAAEMRKATEAVERAYRKVQELIEQYHPEILAAERREQIKEKGDVIK